MDFSFLTLHAKIFMKVNLAHHNGGAKCRRLGLGLIDDRRILVAPYSA